MPASRVEPEPKTEPKRWETLGDDYKPDLAAHPEEIKDLCPIVITTIAAAPTQNKGPEGGRGRRGQGFAGRNPAVPQAQDRERCPGVLPHEHEGTLRQQVLSHAPPA